MVNHVRSTVPGYVVRYRADGGMVLDGSRLAEAVGYATAKTAQDFVVRAKAAEAGSAQEFEARLGDRSCTAETVSRAVRGLLGEALGDPQISEWAMMMNSDIEAPHTASMDDVVEAVSSQRPLYRT